jgi:hyperosmotically inducible protein
MKAKRLMRVIMARSPGLLFLVTALAAGLIFTTGNVYGQRFRATVQTERILRQLEMNTDRFSRSIDAALDRSRLNESNLEDQVNALVDEFEFATDRLKERVEDNMVISLDVNEVLRRGMHLDAFMHRHTLAAAAERDWRVVRNDLDQLARVYGVTWTWIPEAVRRSPLTKASTKQVIQRLEDAADQFRTSFDAGVDRSRLDGSSYEDFMNKVVAEFERSVDKLEEQSGDLNAADVRVALNNAAAIDDFLRRQRLDARTQRDWARVKANLDDLAFLNSVAWDWTMRRSIGPVVTIAPLPRNFQAQGQRVGLGRMVNPSLNAVAREVRHELLSDLPYYSVFDWIEFEVLPDNTVVLRGEVTTPPDTKSRAEDVVKDVPGVTRVINEIQVLPVSPNDERLRRALYNAIYNFNSPLFRYGVGSRQAIHIIVDRGRATLKGVVDSEADRQLAYQRARGVSGLFAVNNELMVEGESLVR